MVKGLGIFFLMALLLLNLVGCSGGSYTMTVGEIETHENVLRGEYNSFSGYYFKEVELEEGQTLTAIFSAETEKGNLIAKVIDSGGTTSKELQEGDTVSINIPGEYKLQVEGNKHKGSFTLSWEIE